MPIEELDGDTERKIAALYDRWCKQHGYRPQQPGIFEVEGDVVTIANVRGVLATYRLRPDGSVRMIGSTTTGRRPLLSRRKINDIS